MRFLIDEDLPRSSAELVRCHGHDAIDIRDIGLRGSPDYKIALYARKEHVCLITGDFDFADIRNYPPNQYDGIVVLSLPKDATAAFILKLLNGFLLKKQLLSKLSGRSAIVEPGRIRIRRGGL